MANKTYWLERAQNNIYKNDIAKFDKQLIKTYKQAFRSIDNQLKDIWLDMMSSGEVSANAIYQNNRLRGLMSEVDNQLKKLGIYTNDNLQLNLIDAYKTIYKETAFQLDHVNVSFNMLHEQIAKEVVNSSFKNATYSQRIWNNLGTIRTQIEKSVTDTAVSRQDYKRVSRALAERMGVSISDSRRIVVTESARVMNEACRQSAKDRGYNSYSILFESDACDECLALEGQHFNIADSVLPVHPNCRCCMIIDLE